MQSNQAFQWKTIDHRETVARHGLASGTMIRKRVVISFAPSILAESSSSSGIDSKKFLTIITV